MCCLTIYQATSSENLRKSVNIRKISNLDGGSLPPKPPPPPHVPPLLGPNIYNKVETNFILTSVLYFCKV